MKKIKNAGTIKHAVISLIGLVGFAITTVLFLENIGKNKIFFLAYLISIGVLFYYILIMVVAPWIRENFDFFDRKESDFKIVKNLVLLVSIFSLITVIISKLEIGKHLEDLSYSRELPKFYIEIQTNELDAKVVVAYRNRNIKYAGCMFSKEPGGSIYPIEMLLVNDWKRDVYFIERKLGRDKFKFEKLHFYIFDAPSLKKIVDDFYRQSYSNISPRPFTEKDFSFLSEVENIVMIPKK